jgi:imidazolonepropionase-like amidohydrolase
MSMRRVVGIARGVSRWRTCGVAFGVAFGLALGLGPTGLAPAAQAQPVAPDSSVLVLRPARVFDGDSLRTGLAVLVRGGRIADVAPTARLAVPAGARVLELPNATLLPGLIDLHSHVLLHAYNETPWDDQVLREPLGERVARAVVHLRRTLEAGFTTLRDLGTEGAGDADVGLKRAVEKGVVPGPRLVVANRAIVMRGSYAPSGFAPEVAVPQGAEEAAGFEELSRVVRDQIRRGADVIKVYADYRWGPNGEARPAFTLAELQRVVEIAASSGRPVVAHAVTPEGMRRATLAGVQTIEHGDDGTAEVFRLMRERGTILVPTVAAGDAVSRYRGWVPGQGAEPARIAAKRASVKAALEAGVLIANGSDVGVFSHGENWRELELLAAYGMSPAQVLRAATSIAGRVVRPDGSLGVVKPGAVADLVAVDGDPTRELAVLRRMRLVLQGGRVVVAP